MIQNFQKQMISDALEHSTERFLMIWDAAIDMGDVDTVEYYITTYRDLLVSLGYDEEIRLAREAIDAYQQQPVDCGQDELYTVH